MTAGPGLFGKLPEAGDFIARGLAAGQRRALDRWITAHLAARRGRWPDGGLRGLLDLDGDLVLMVVVASADRVGRRFPLAATTRGDRLTFEAAERWCDGAVLVLERAARAELGIVEAMAALQGLEPAEADGPTGAPALWLRGGAPQVCDGETVARFFSSG